MKVTVIPVRHLPEELRNAWIKAQTDNPDLLSPYFHPEFTQIVASHREDVQIAIIEQHGKVVGFFPFQRETRSVGRPVGHPLSDYHGVICSTDFDFDPVALVRSCGLTAWDYDHVPIAQKHFQPFHRYNEQSPIIDLTIGYEKYISQRKAGGAFRKPLQLLRKLEREIGPLSFKPHVRDISLLHFIMKKKTEQFKRTGQRDLFATEWIKRTVETIFNTQTQDFGGMLSAVYAGSKMVAALMSIRSSAVCHAWFMGFEDSLLSYSPGMILYLKFAECGDGLGFRYLDIGKGDQQHKLRLMTGSISVGAGSVEVPSWLSFRRNVVRSLRAVATDSRLGVPVRKVVHLARGGDTSASQWSRRGEQKITRD